MGGNSLIPPGGSVKTEPATPGSTQSIGLSRKSDEADPSNLSHVSTVKSRPSIALGACGDLHFRTAVLFYRASSVLDVCYIVIRR